MKSGAERARGRWRWAVPALALLALLASPARADDVPAAARSAYDEAGRVLATEGTAGAEPALARLAAHADEAADSVDYWERYGRLWRRLGRADEAFWRDVITPRQAQAPASPVFDLVRARLADDAEAQRTWLDKAVAREADGVRARVALGRFLLAQGETDEGAALLEAILAEAPATVGAREGLAELCLAEGFPGEALAHLAVALEHAPSAALHDLVSRCHERRARVGDHATCMTQALEAEGRAVALSPTDPYVERFETLLAATGDALTATRLLRKALAASAHPRLGSMLAAAALRAGDHESAIVGLEAGDPDDLATKKGLALCHARLGHVAEVKRRIGPLLQADPESRPFLAGLLLHVGEPAAARGILGSRADPQAKRMRALAFAWEGDVAALRSLVAAEVATGSRAGEDLLTAWFQARILARLGPARAREVRATLLDARFKAGHDILVQAGESGVDLGAVITAGWPRRALTYFRAPCGVPYRHGGEDDVRGIRLDAAAREMTLYHAAAGEAMCGGTRHAFEARYNLRTAKMSEGDFVEVLRAAGDDVELGDFAPAEAAFAEACAGWMGGRHDAADAACARALEIEPAFSRVTVYRAVARALAPTGDPRAVAEAVEAAAFYADDFELRRTVLLLRALAGAQDLDAEVRALARREAKMNVRTLSAL